MAETTIGWTVTVLADGTILPGYTFNPWIGCTKVSAGCGFCYAEAQDRFRNWTPEGWGPGRPRRRTNKLYWENPLVWNQGARNKGVRLKVFCASLADWLDHEVPIEWLADLLDLIRRTPHLDWLLLTKRPENFKERMLAALRHNENNGGSEELHAWLLDWVTGTPPSNVWIGTTVENQEMADKRIPELLDIPAKVHFLSCEPMLGHVTISNFVESEILAYAGSSPEFDCWQPHPSKKWVICGGASGTQEQPFCVEFADDLRRQCKASGVPFFMKQMGSNPVTSNANLYDWPDHVEFIDYSSFAASAKIHLRHRKGEDINEWPEEFQVREFPAVA
ncbi:MAG: phage Gp37/Gp68 family protein [Puniceicoccales bacterium]|jgi:protein gp37|nr:phage Gp37/Gp68 family protein [Puniceicoccales bacterium]